MESAPRSALQCAAPFPRFHRSTDPECDSRKPSTGCEFFLFQSRFTLSNPSRRLRKERTSGKPQAAFARVERALLPACRQHLKAHGQECPRHTTYCTISEIVPAPTVCPPSRIAKRKPFSIATGVINSITSETLSPGITISVPAGSSATPVTSVVLK